MIKLLLPFTLIIGFVACKTTTGTQVLDDGDPAQNPAVEIRPDTIFNKVSTEIWGLEKDACKDFRENNNEALSSGSCLQLDWNKSTCDWVGFGVGWSGWAAKDLSASMADADIELYIRSIKGETNIPTMVFLLEDYSGRKTAALFNTSCLSSYPVNENWQLCTLPLSLFTYEKDGVDITNVKQLVIEMYGEGHILMDNMSIQPKTGRPLPLKKEFPPSVVPLEAPVTLFDETFVQVWGLEKNPCRDYRISHSDAHSGGISLYMGWNAEGDCEHMEWGTSWTKWLAVDFNQNKEQTALEFFIRNKGRRMAAIPLKVGLESYEKIRSGIKVDAKYAAVSSFGDEWVKVIIPIRDFFKDHQDLNPGNIKQLYFTAAGSGEVYIDEIKIINLK